jgi:hypothetical protein
MHASSPLPAPRLHPHTPSPLSHSQVEQHRPTASDVGAASGVGVDVSGDGAPSGAREIRLTFDEFYVTDLQPPDPTSTAGVAGVVAFVDSNGKVNGPALSSAKPNVFIVAPTRLKKSSSILGLATPSGVSAAVVRAWERRYSYLKRTAAGTVKRSTTGPPSSSGLPKPTGPGLGPAPRGHQSRGSIDFSDPAVSHALLGAALQPIVAEDSGSSSEDLDNDDDGGTSGGGSGGAGAGWGGTGAARKPLGGASPVIRLVDGREFPPSGRPAMLVVSVTLPAKNPVAEAKIDAWADQNAAYRRAQVHAWAGEASIPLPKRDLTDVDLMSGVRLRIQADSITAVHSKRFEDELKGAVDVMKVLQLTVIEPL